MKNDVLTCFVFRYVWTDWFCIFELENKVDSNGHKPLYDDSFYDDDTQGFFIVADVAENHCNFYLHKQINMDYILLVVAYDRNVLESEWGKKSRNISYGETCFSRIM